MLSPVQTHSHDEFNNIWGIWRNEIITNIKGDLEYIRPMKLSRNLYEDPGNYQL